MKRLKSPGNRAGTQAKNRNTNVRKGSLKKYRNSIGFRGRLAGTPRLFMPLSCYAVNVLFTAADEKIALSMVPVNRKPQYLGF
jgi:hypothetical protein